MKPSRRRDATVFFIIAVTLLDITKAQAQTVLQLNAQTSSSESTVASDTLGIPTSSSPSTSLSGPALGSAEPDPLSVLIGKSISPLGTLLRCPDGSAVDRFA
jgi:hypothetical protein